MSNLNKVFLSHLHADHFGDLDALYVGGLISGRTGALNIWGPSGDRPELGTAAAVTAMQKMLAWDIEGRKGRLLGRTLIWHAGTARDNPHLVRREVLGIGEVSAPITTRFDRGHARHPALGDGG